MTCRSKHNDRDHLFQHPPPPRTGRLWLGVIFYQEGTTMGTIEQIDVQSYTEYATAIYITDDGEEYEIVFTKHYDENIGYEEKTVVHVEKDGKSVDPDEPIWEEIRTQLS
jgi:hypothetical protein